MPDKPGIPLHLFQILEEEYNNLYGQPGEGGEAASANAAYETNANAASATTTAPTDDEVEVWLPERGGGDDAESGGEVAGRVVRAGRDWRFRAGHLRDGVGLASEILGGGAQGARVAPSHLYDEWAKENLRAHLHRLMAQNVLAGTVEGRTKTADARTTLANLRGRLAVAEREQEAVTLRLEELRGSAADHRDEDDEQSLRHSQAELKGVIAGLLRQRDALRKQIEDADEPLRKELDKLLDNPGLYSGERFPASWLTPMVGGLVGLHLKSGLEGDALRQLNRFLLEAAFPKHVERIQHIRLAALVRRFHERKPKAVSLSGGGIRSGTFALGLLQGLARHDLLKSFDYLSTVSGGGYIGGWLTAWLHRHPEGLEGVTRELANQAPVSKVDPDPRPIRYLREYSNFITPKVGALTADTWAFIGIYLRNLLLNWAVFLPLMLALLMLPRMLLTYTLYQPTGRAVPAAEALKLSPEQVDAVPGMDKVPKSLRVVFKPKPRVKNFFNLPVLRTVFMWREGDDPDAAGLYPRHLLLIAGFLLGVWGLGYAGFNRPGVRETLRERSKYWRNKSGQRSFLLWCLLPLVASAMFLTTYWAWAQEISSTVKGVGYFMGFGVSFTVGGWLVAILVLRRVRYKGGWRLREMSGREIFSVVLAGMLGGLLFWVVTLVNFSDPIKGYGVVARRVGGGPLDWKVVNAPLAWTDWTSWTLTDWTTELYVCTAVPLFLLVFWAGVTLFVGLTSASAKVSDEDREWWARFGAWLLIVAIAWVVLGATVIFGPLALLEFPKLLASVGGVAGLISVLVGKSALTPARSGATDEKDKSKAGAAARLLTSSLPLLGLVFLLSVAACLSLLTTGITRWLALQAPAVCEATGVDRFGANLSVQGWTAGVKFVPHDFEEFFSNVPESARDAAAPGPTPYHGFGVGPQPDDAIDSYKEFITPVVPTLVRPPATPSPQPDSTPCTPACPSPAERAEEVAARTADDYVGARIVHMNVLHHTSHWFTTALALLLLGVGMLLSWLINLNYFSLHAGYRNRLIRAFLGASRPPGQRKPNPFTGFDPSDNLHMHELRPALLDEDDILDQTALYEALLDQANELSRRLAERGLLANVHNESSSTPSPSLVAALRADLNAALESERLYLLPFAQKHFQGGVARRVKERILEDSGSEDLVRIRGSYRVLLNRLVLESEYPKTLRPGQYPPPPYKLLHVVNTSLNLVGGEKLAWQQRKAEPFSISPLHSGCYRLGYRRSRVYGGKETGGISIGTAAAISGAAASSNMGYYTTSPIISLLLTLFNVRLGWWLGNPGPAGQNTYQLSGPKLSVSPVVYEAFGLTNDLYKYVYLTDGGHFENLGLYEMVLRRCHLVVVSDAAADGEYRFGDLGNAVRKIRIDLGVPIEFRCFDIYGWDESQRRRSKDDKSRGMYWALARIRYSCIDKVGVDENGRPRAAEDGILIYVKPALYGDEPRDVLEYRESFPAFPHQSTGDQFFDEPQFESYRALGSFIVDEMCRGRFGSFDPMTIEDFVGAAFAGTRRHCPEDFGALGETDNPAVRAERFRDWLGGVGDASLRRWLEELAEAEGLLRPGGAARDS
jgi:Patatin-like phospholipase